MQLLALLAYCRYEKRYSEIINYCAVFERSRGQEKTKPSELKAVYRYNVVARDQININI